MTKNIICTACPRGCHLRVSRNESAYDSTENTDIEVFGNNCPKGIVYGRQEIILPMRTLTTTLAYSIDTDKNVSKQIRMRLPVKTTCEIPLKDMTVTIQKIRNIHITKPVHCGEIIGVLKGEDGREIPIAACASTEETV